MLRNDGIKAIVAGSEREEYGLPIQLRIDMNSELRLKPMSPKKVGNELKLLVQHLALDAQAAVQLKFTRPLTFEAAEAECHLNAWCQIRSHGGSIQHGWVLAEDKAHEFCEAIFHTVWRSPEGALIDVTPRRDKEKRVLFIPDAGRAPTLSSYQGQPAICTYASVKMLRGNLLEPIQQFTALLQSGFAQKHGLWPW